MQNNNAYLGRNEDIPGLKLIASGKVRDIYEINEEHLLFVTTDRISAFDVIMNEGVPNKGKVLTTITAWWFEQTADICANHLIEVPCSNIVRVRKAQALPIEIVVRRHVTGSLWRDVEANRHGVYEVPLPDGTPLRTGHARHTILTIHLPFPRCVRGLAGPG